MQRIEVNFNEKECVIMESWTKKKDTVIKEIEKEIFIKDEEEKFLLNFSKVECGVGILLKVKSNKGYLINNEIGKGLKEITFDIIDKLMGVFSLSKKYLEDEILVKFTKEYKLNGYYESYEEYQQWELNTITCFTWSIHSRNLFNVIRYSDFENKGELSLAIHSYVNYVYNYGRVVGEIEEFIETKLEILGYERNPKLKGKRPIYEKEDEDKVNLESVSLKSLNYAFENLLEVFYKIAENDIEEGILEVKKYSYILARYYVRNNGF